MTEPKQIVSVKYVGVLNISFDWRDSPVTQKLKIPISTIIYFQKIKFGEGDVT